MSVDVAAELDPPNLSFTAYHHSQHVFINNDRTISIVIDTWRLACAASAVQSRGLTSAIIDGVPFGPTPTPDAEWVFITSRPYIIIEEWQSTRGRIHFAGPQRMTVKARLRAGYKVAKNERDGKRAVWRAYPEVEAEQRRQLAAAIQDARDGRPAVKREGTVTFEDGYPKSA
jgi:hypothetical protein